MKETQSSKLKLQLRGCSSHASSQSSYPSFESTGEVSRAHVSFRLAKLIYSPEQSRFYLPALKDLITTLKKTPSNERAAFLDRKAQLLKSRCQVTIGLALTMHF